MSDGAASGRASAVGESDARWTSATRAATATVARHPVATVAVIGVLAAVLHLSWVAGHRGVGGLGVDESGFAATAIRFEQALAAGGPSGLVTAVFESPTAPLVPLLALPSLAVGSTSVAAVVGAQAAVSVALAAAVAGLTGRLAGRGASVVAGIVAVGLPVHVVTARYVQFASAVSACLCAALWALLASERGHRRGPMVAAGVAVGCMLLSRTMSIAFLPAVVAAAAVTLRRDRRAATNATIATAVAVVIAGPWWWSNWSTTTRYLVSFGYGSGAEQIEQIPLALRIPVRVGLATVDVRWPLLAVVAATTALVVAERGRTLVAGGIRRFVVEHRPTAAVVAAAAVGLVALVSSSNSGSWFQLPVESLAVALVVTAGSTLTVPRRRWLAGAAVVVATCNVLLISVWTPGSSTRLGGVSASALLFGGTEEVQAIDFEAIDSRFAPDASWPERRDAEHEWARATSRLAAALEELDPMAGPPNTRSFVGEIRLLDASTLDLWYVWRGVEPPPIESATAPEAMRGRPDADIGRRVDGRERILVAVRAADGTAGARVDPGPLLARAEDEGWVTARTLRLPAGATAAILRHEDRR